jgi:hypothetical protein
VEGREGRSGRTEGGEEQTDGRRAGRKDRGEERNGDLLPSEGETASRVDETSRVVYEGSRDGVEGGHLTESLCQMGKSEREMRR